MSENTKPVTDDSFATDVLNADGPTADMGPQMPDELLYRVVDALEEIGAEVGHTVAQVALNWLVQRPTVSTVVFGARNEAQLRENLGAVDFKLTAEQVERLDKVSGRPPVYPYWHQRRTSNDRNPPPTRP